LAGVVTSLASFAVAMPVKAIEAVDVGGGEGSLVGGKGVGVDVREDGGQCVVAHRSDVRWGRRAGQQVPTPCRVGGVAPGTCRAAAKSQKVTAEVLVKDRQMEQNTSPVKVMTRTEIEVDLGGAIAISTSDVVVEAQLEAGGEATGVEGHGLHQVLQQPDRNLPRLLYKQYIYSRMCTLCVSEVQLNGVLQESAHRIACHDGRDPDTGMYKKQETHIV
jgi:hypothetical protein